MNKNEILNHRKNKFLSIGRNYGFTSESTLSENLSMKENFINKLKSKFKKNNKILYLSLLILFSIFLAIILL